MRRVGVHVNVIRVRVNLLVCVLHVLGVRARVVHRVHGVMIAAEERLASVFHAERFEVEQVCKQYGVSKISRFALYHHHRHPRSYQS